MNDRNKQKRLLCVFLSHQLERSDPCSGVSQNFCEITMCQKVGLDQLLSKSWVLLELDDKSNNSDVLLSRSLNKGGIDTIKYFG